MWKYLTGSTPTPSKSGFEFKMQNSFEKRKEESARLRLKFPDKIPIVLEKSDTSILPNIDKKKFLMQKDITLGQFLHIIRSRIKLDPTEAIFLIVDTNTIPGISSTIGEIYEKNGDKDGFLYITYSAQQAFG